MNRYNNNKIIFTAANISMSMCIYKITLCNNPTVCFGPTLEKGYLRRSHPGLTTELTSHCTKEPSRHINTIENRALVSTVLVVLLVPLVVLLLVWLVLLVVVLLVLLVWVLLVVLVVRIYGLKQEGLELFIRDFRKIWRYNEFQCWITEKRIKETNTQNCFKMISEKQSVVLSKQSVVFISS